MPDNKNFCLRVKILDGLLRKREGVTIHEMLHVVNKRLEERGIRPVRTRDTILKDMTEIANEYHVKIQRIREADDSRVIRYRYENRDFSIYESWLSEKLTLELRDALQILSRCKGLPEIKWIKELCLSMDIPLRNGSNTILEFDVALEKIGKKCFQGLFLAILEKKTIEINYMDYDSLSVQLMVFPYYLKQFERKWYLVAVLMNDEDSLKVFDLDRIRHVYFHSEMKYKPIEVDFNEYFKDIYGIHRDTGKSPITILFRVSHQHMHTFIDNPIHHTQILVSHGFGFAIFSIRVIPNVELVHKFLSFGDMVTILTDCELRDEIVYNLKQSIRKYELST